MLQTHRYQYGWLTKRLIRVVTALAATSVLLAACSSSPASSKAGGTSAPSGSSQASVAVKFQVYPGNLVNLVTYVAQEEGFFQKNGINAQLVPIGS